MSDLLGKIRSRGYWQVTIRPQVFRPRRIAEILELLPILTTATVRIRGWDFPHFDSRSQPQLDLDWVGQESDWEHHKAVWRFYQSGQFIYIFSMAIDWRDESSIWRADQSWRPMSLLGVGDTLFTFAEIMELASRLAITEAGDDQMHVSVKVANVAGRALYVDSHRNRWPFHTTYRASMQDYPYELDATRGELAAEVRSYALEAASQLFNRFGWDPSREILQDWYDKRG